MGPSTPCSETDGLGGRTAPERKRQNGRRAATDECDDDEGLFSPPRGGPLTVTIL